MSRSSWKVPFVSNMFFSNLFKKSKVLSLWQRPSIIPAVAINKKFKIHNGVWLLSLNVKTSMIGHKFGEFAFTKRMGKDIHFKKKVKKKNK